MTDPTVAKSGPLSPVRNRRVLPRPCPRRIIPYRNRRSVPEVDDFLDTPRRDQTRSGLPPVVLLYLHGQLSQFQNQICLLNGVRFSLNRSMDHGAGKLAVQSADVIVVGGGLAGLSAAALVARAGRSVIVVEQAGHLGGAPPRTFATRFTGTSAPRSLLCGPRFSSFQRPWRFVQRAAPRALAAGCW